MLKRLSVYSMGAIILAIGLTLNTKAGLGVSPIISIAFSISEIFRFNFGTMTFVLYTIFVIVEMILHMHDKHLLIIDLLQLPFSLIFSYFLNIFGAFIPDFTMSSYVIRFLVLFMAILCTGVGAATMLNMRLIPNPGDGIVAAIASKVGKDVGFTKNCVDIFCVFFTSILSYVLCGSIMGVGIGTLFAMVLVGRVIALVNHLPMLQE